MKIWLGHILEKLRASAWSTPAIYLILAIALSQYTQWLDRRYMGFVFEHFDFLEISSVDDARTLVGTIATSMLAVAGVSFSSIMVTMTLASQQFGPRILRNFLKDSTSQTTLGVLMGTYVFCLFVMRGIRSYDGQDFVPQVSTLVAMCLAITSLAVFIHFIHHILNEIQAETVVADTYRGLEEAIETVFPSEDGESESPDIPDVSRGWDIIANKSGYIQAISYPALAEIAREQDALFTTKCKAGSFISDQQPLVTVISGPAPEEVDEQLIKCIQNAFIVGRVRTPEQDYEYGFRQLVEMALRALSPGTNDPFTAMDCLNYLGAALQTAFSRPLPASAFRDKDDNLRLIAPPHDYESLVEAAFNQVRQAAVDKCDVSCRLLEIIGKCARVAPHEEQ